MAGTIASTWDMDQDIDEMVQAAEAEQRANALLEPTSNTKGVLGAFFYKFQTSAADGKLPWVCNLCGVALTWGLMAPRASTEDTSNYPSEGNLEAGWPQRDEHVGSWLPFGRFWVPYWAQLDAMGDPKSFILAPGRRKYR